MKLILEILWMFIWRKSPYYIIDETIYKELLYSTYSLTQICYLFYFIPIKIPRDYCTSIENRTNNTVSKWYKKYDQKLNNKHTIKNITHYYDNLL